MNNQTPQPPATDPIGAYIAAFPPATQEKLTQMREILRAQAPKAEETIKYGVPTFTLNGKSVLHFGGYAKHVGFYPGSRTIEAFAAELTPYKHARGSVQFPLKQPLPVDLINRMAAYAIAQFKK
ncbi:MAG: DUF1801 domain-containing protein [Caldilineaceae bacterium]|nr:DUF1801 domain-containing protein [Caldilineaceae bacterium]